MLTESDSTLHTTLLNDLPKDTKYTLIYLTTPSTLPASTCADQAIIYEPDFNDALHIDLKRNLAAATKPNGTIPDPRPLFEKYQFLSPGMYLFPIFKSQREEKWRLMVLKVSSWVSWWALSSLLF